MMVPDDASSFPPFFGKLFQAKKQKKLVKKKKNLNVSLDKIEKINIIQKKKERKNKILNTGNENNSVPSTSDKEKKFKKILPGSSLNAASKKVKKTKKNVPSPCNKELSIQQQYAQDNAVCESVIDAAVPSSSNNILPAYNGNIVLKKGKTISTPPKTSVELRKNTASTPRFKRKNCDSIKSLKNKSNVLCMVDSYISTKNRHEGYSQGTELKKSANTTTSYADKGSSEALGEPTLQKLLYPVNVNTFLRENWEKKPIYIPGNDKKFSSFISTEMIDSVMRDYVILFGKHLDVTTYTGGVKENHNLEGRAHAHVVWDFYSNGCSIRLLNPQNFMNSMHVLNSHLQEFFGSFVGSNVYLTPPNSQGFAPHFDDIEAIILQVEGSKHWKIYPPFKDSALPRFSSINLSDEEIGEPMMEVTLKAGDVLYFPRGFIHQGRTEDEHSLHITLSTYQRTSWSDYLEKLLPLTLKKACNQDVEFRKGMPIGYLKSAGLAHKTSCQMRKNILDNLKTLMKRMTDYLDIDSAMDEMGLKLIHEALPPVLTPREAACSVVGGGLRMEKNGQLSHHISFTLDTCVRWIRSYCYRIVEENVSLDNGVIEKQTRVYYTLDNSREYCKEEPQFLILPSEMVPGVLYLTSAYPQYVRIADIPLNSDDEKVTLVGDLWDRGLLVTDSPLGTTLMNSIKSDLENIEEEKDVSADLVDSSLQEDEDGSSSITLCDELVEPSKSFKLGSLQAQSHSETDESM